MVRGLGDKDQEFVFDVMEHMDPMEGYKGGHNVVGMTSQEDEYNAVQSNLKATLLGHQGISPV